jgi:hypothetical protein
MSEELATVIMVCTALVCSSAVLLLRPLAKRLGALIDASTSAKLRPPPEPEIARLGELLTRIDGRLNQMEERQDFAEALLSASDPKLLHGPPFQPQERN